MAIFKHRDIEAVMPPEVRRRARRGVGKGKVDWYAGRRYQPNSHADSLPENEQIDFTEQMLEARREIKLESAAARREKAAKVAQATASRAQLILAPVMQRIHRFLSDARTHQV